MKPQVFKIKNKTFSKHRPLIIAEIGTSHNGSLEKAKALVDAAKKAGATAVKFQIVYADEILHPNTGLVKLPTGNIPLYEKFKSLEVPGKFYRELADYSRRQKLLFSASPFGLRSARELIRLQPDFIKIASPELNYIQLLEYCAKAKMPMILSTGVSKLADIEKALVAIKKPEKQAPPIAILHCVTSYPAPEESYNVSLIKNLQNIFSVPVGLSDHSKDAVLVPLLSLAFGGCIIEKHICLSRKESGLDDPVALESADFKKMCNAVKTISKFNFEEIIDFLLKLGYSKKRIDSVIGSGKKELSFAEKANYGRTNRSIHYLKSMPKNSVIHKTDIAILRTEKELSVGEAPDTIDFFIGAVLQKSVKAGDGVLFDDFIKKEKR